MKRIDPLEQFEAFTNRLMARFSAMKKRDRTTKGILHYIQEHHNEKITNSESEFGNAEYLALLEKIFQYVPSDTPKMLMCVHCGNTVTIPEICACGKIQDVYKSIEKLLDRKLTS